MMRKLLYALSWILVGVVCQAQSNLLLLMDDDAGFDPLTYDANTIALYDGDLELTTAGWGDQSDNNYDISFTDSPTINADAINGHREVVFDGTSQYGNRATTPTLTQPFTIYIVFKQITWTVNDVIFADNTGSVALFDNVGSNNMTDYAGGLAPSTDPDPTINTYDIITNVFDGASTELRTNDNTAATGNAGTNNGAGFVIAANAGGATPSNIAVAYIIIRSGADNTATQDLFINFLKTRFGL